MIGVQETPAQLFYDFDLEAHVPANHILREIDRFLDVSIIRPQLAAHYSHLGRPSIDPELIIRMLIVGYVLGIRSERRLCDEVHLNLAYRWFCRLDLNSKVPDHSTFSKYRHGKFRDSDLLRSVFEATVARCISEGLVGGHGFAVDASLIEADVDRMDSTAQSEWDVSGFGGPAVYRTNLRSQQSPRNFGNSQSYDPRPPKQGSRCDLKRQNDSPTSRPDKRAEN